jgi:hypothetical protein
LVRREPTAAAFHAAVIDIFLMGEVAQPCSDFAIRGPIVAHESVDHNVEFGLTLIAFGWRVHLTAPFGVVYETDLAPLGLKKASPRGALIQIKIQQMPSRFYLATHETNYLSQKRFRPAQPGGFCAK